MFYQVNVNGYYSKTTETNMYVTDFVTVDFLQYVCLTTLLSEAIIYSWKIV